MISGRKVRADTSKQFQNLSLWERTRHSGGRICTNLVVFATPHRQPLKLAFCMETLGRLRRSNANDGVNVVDLATKIINSYIISRQVIVGSDQQFPRSH